jgi:protein O-GlcNAc transferase
MGTDVSKILEEANRCFFRNDYEGAEILYQRILDDEPEHPLCLQRLARIELARRRPEQAVAYYTRSLAASPDDLNTWNDLGNLRYDLKQYDQAIECYRRALELNGGYYWAAFNIGLAIRQQASGDQSAIEAARSWFETTLRLNPDY